MLFNEKVTSLDNINQLIRKLNMIAVNMNTRQHIRAV